MSSQGMHDWIYPPYYFCTELLVLLLRTFGRKQIKFKSDFVEAEYSRTITTSTIAMSRPRPRAEVLRRNHILFHIVRSYKIPKTSPYNVYKNNNINSINNLLLIILIV